jgi:uncharacterized protein
MEPRFILDGMLGSLARKLRILGYDSVFDKESDDTQLLSFCRKSGRELLTADVDLYLRAKKQGLPSILILSRTDRGRLLELFSALGRRSVSADFPRCSACNGELKGSGKVSREGKVVFFCTSCGKEYWRGSHWKKLELLFRGVNQLLQEEPKTVG